MKINIEFSNSVYEIGLIRFDEDCIDENYATKMINKMYQ
jgi:hypothetical protein